MYKYTYSLRTMSTYYIHFHAAHDREKKKKDIYFGIYGKFDFQ